MSWSPDNAWLATGGNASSLAYVTDERIATLVTTTEADGYVLLDDVHAQYLHGFTTQVTATAWSADSGQLALGDDDGTLRVGRP